MAEEIFTARTLVVTAFIILSSRIVKKTLSAVILMNSINDEAIMRIFNDSPDCEVRVRGPGVDPISIPADRQGKMIQFVGAGYVVVTENENPILTTTMGNGGCSNIVHVTSASSALLVTMLRGTFLTRTPASLSIVIRKEGGNQGFTLSVAPSASQNIVVSSDQNVIINEGIESGNQNLVFNGFSGQSTIVHREGANWKIVQSF